MICEANHGWFAEMLHNGIRIFQPQTLALSPAGGAIMGQRFCTLTQKFLFLRTFRVFRGKNTPLSPLHLFLNLMYLNLRLYGGILNLYCSYDIIYLM